MYQGCAGPCIAGKCLDPDEITVPGPAVCKASRNRDVGLTDGFLWLWWFQEGCTKACVSNINFGS